MLSECFCGMMILLKLLRWLKVILPFLFSVGIGWVSAVYKASYFQGETEILGGVGRFIWFMWGVLVPFGALMWLDSRRRNLMEGKFPIPRKTSIA